MHTQSHLVTIKCIFEDDRLHFLMVLSSSCASPSYSGGTSNCLEMITYCIDFFIFFYIALIKVIIFVAIFFRKVADFVENMDQNLLLEFTAIFLWL